MDNLLEQESKDANLNVESGDENLPCLTFIERYERFLQGNHFDDPDDSDSDYFPDIAILREEYNQLKHERSEKFRANTSNRLSTGLPGKQNSLELNNVTATRDPINKQYEIQNGSTDAIEFTSGDTKQTKDERSGLNGLNKLIEKLETVRRCGPGGNSINCTRAELEAIQNCYSEILEYIHEKSGDFEKQSNSTMTPQQSDEQDEDRNELEDQIRKPQEESQDRILLTKKMESVQRARDRYYEVEQLVQESIEQLELVERYKMESE